MKQNLTLALLFFTLHTFAQNVKVEHGYDDAGNRVSREVIQLMIQPSDNDKDEFQQAQEDTPVAEATTGTEDVEPIISRSGKYSFNIYPNPTQGIVHIEAEDNFMSLNNRSVQVYDLSGKLVYENTINDNRFSIDFSGMHAGVYVVMILAEGYGKEVKIVVSR